jgi:hypothetical protein
MHFSVFLFFLMVLNFSNTSFSAQASKAGGKVAEEQVSADDRFQLLTGPKLKILFSDFYNVEYPSDKTSYYAANYQFTFQENNTWKGEHSGNGAETWGHWRIEDSSVCITVKSENTDNFPYEGCFSVYVNWRTGVIAGSFPNLGGNRHILKEQAFSELERLNPKTTAPLEMAQDEKNNIKHNQALEIQRLELERQRIEFRKSASEIQQLKLKLELERLQQKRVSAPDPSKIIQKDTTPPVIQAKKTIVTRSEFATIKGSVKDDGKIVRVEFDGQKINVIEGYFSIKIPVNLGRTKIRIAAFDAGGNRAERIVMVIRNRDIPNITYGDYYALVIGINEYKSLPKLNTAVTDSQTVAKTLEELYGYNVTLLMNASRDDILDAFDDLRDKLSEQDNLLIYYAGHGWLDQQTGSGYWLPVNAKPDRRSRWFSNATLTEALQGMLAKHVIVVADSCYSGTLTRSVKITERNPNYLRRISEKRARVVLSSGGLEPVADSGGGKHSVFAAQFLKSLRNNQGVLDGTQMFEQVRKGVVINADQTPEYSDIRRAGHEGGDFLFVRKD